MKILVLGGTRFFGIRMVQDLLKMGHEVAIGTRGLSKDPFGEQVKRIALDRSNGESLRQALQGKRFDLVIDKIAYCSNDIKRLLDFIDCQKYIYMSTTAVYAPKKNNLVEEDFDPLAMDLVWCERKDFPYGQVKMQAEAAITQKYPGQKYIAVRYPVVLGKDDYTKRLLFYAEHVARSVPMYIDNLDAQMSFIRSDEAGAFMAFLADKNFCGAVNGASKGTVSLREIIEFLEKKTGKKAFLSTDGEAAPYNGESEFSVNTDKAKALGFEFSDVNDWIYDLLEYFLFFQ
ncbi:MAG: NAD-dependent epimerase/dehydratase family protein [Treponema sp.]|nr:NAD-dependent epimerase/dehydratase family protein [Treponema sp.]